MAIDGVNEMIDSMINCSFPGEKWLKNSDILITTL